MQGQLFTQDFLTRGVTETPPHQALTDAAFAAFRHSLQGIFNGLDSASTINEAQTEALVINKVLVALGWGDDLLPQVNLSGKRREDVPDVLLFADITLKLYAGHPVLVKHGVESASMGQQPDVKVWPVKYVTMFHMTNDSQSFFKAEELKKQGFQPVALNRWINAQGAEAVPLYEGKMVQMYDHRAADVVVNSENLHRAAQPESIPQQEKTSLDRYPKPQFFVSVSETKTNPYQWAFGYKEISAPTNERSMIATLLPAAAFGNKVPLLIPQGVRSDEAARTASLIAANFNSFAFDFVLRQKLQGQTINLFILEQLPVIAPARFNEPLPAAFAQAMRAAGLMNGHHPQPTVADFVIPQVLALTYTAHDMAPFARDLGYVDAAGEVLPPLVWNEEDRRTRLAALDALFFHLYGLNADDTAYILDTFPIVREQDTRAFGRYRTKEDILQGLDLLMV